MMVLDANILVRGALGRRVRNLILKYAGKILFLTPPTKLPPGNG